MKKLLVFVFVFVLFTAVGWSKELNTLIGGSRWSWGGFGGPVAHVSRTDAGLRLFTGGQGALLINHRLAIGGGGGDLQVDSASRLLDMDAPQVGYGGFLVGYHLFPRSAIHFSVYSLFGVLSETDWQGGVEISTSRPLVIPQINLEFRVTKWMQLALGVSAMYTLDKTEWNGLDASMIDDFHVSALVRFGKF